MCPMKGAETMYKKVLNIISLKTKYKCLGIVALSVVTAVLASLWPVQLGKIYTNVSGGNISTRGRVFCLSPSSALRMRRRNVSLFFGV